jgi:hypothetical protein
MASRKEQKEALRREREAREAAAKQTQQRKRLVGYVVAGGIALAAVIVIAVFVFGSSGSETEGSAGGDVFPDGGSVPTQKVTDLKTAVADANCKLESDPNDDSSHTQSLSEHVKYRTNPPTSGRHYIEPPEDGAYADPIQDEQYVHAMEHGRIIIWFKPSLPEQDRAQLKALFDEDSYQMLITPRKDMPYAVAATAWNARPGAEGTGRLLLCDKYTPQVIDAIRTFRDEHRSNGPEPVP